MNPAFAGVVQFRKIISQMNTWIDKAVAYAADKSFDPYVLMDARLAPDQLAFVEQVLSTCNIALHGAARLSGREPPADAQPTTIEDLRAHLQTVVAHLDGFEGSDFAHWETRVVKLPHRFLPGKAMRGEHYLYEMLMPNILFHATTAYAILRHNGVDLGIADFLGALTVQDA